MKFLIAVGSKEYSKNTLHLGVQIAKAFDAHISIVYVGPKERKLFEGEVDLVRDNLEKWDIFHPGIDVLKWAHGELLKLGYFENAKKNDFNPRHILEENGRFRMVLPSSNGDAELILREGEIVQELRKELSNTPRDLVIIGGSQGKRRMAHDIIQFLPTSVFVVKNMNLKRHYKLLVLTDDSEGTKKALLFAALIAENQKYPIRTLTVSKTKRFGSGYMGAAEYAKAYLKKKNLTVEQFFLSGDPVTHFVQFASDNHITVMGASTANPFKKFFMGSKPISTLKKSRSPILVVR